MESQETPTASQESPVRTNRRLGPILAVAVVLGLAGGIFWWMGPGSYLAQRQEYASKTETFSGSSESLKQTVIVPTLDTPCPPNKNVVWCSSFQLAWNEIRDKVIGAPLEVVGAEEVAARLNLAKQSSFDLEPGSFYAAGGRIKDGVINKIKKDMAAKFASHTLPDLTRYAQERDGLLAYSYLTAKVPFGHPFQRVERGSVFRSSRGEGTEVSVFGVWGLLAKYNKIRKQVEILYCRLEKESDRRVGECVVDLCKDSKPCQVVAAMVEPKGSLAQTLEYVRVCVENSQKSTSYVQDSELHRVDDLKVPEMFWKIDHQFQELIGRQVGNVGMPITEAMQTIEFRLDRSGAVLNTEARFGVTALPREFIFDRPFLIYMQKRGAEHPFFVMWVDNAELLTRK
jgi:hypothetical protein